MSVKTFLTQEIGSIAKPTWRVKGVKGVALSEAEINEALSWSGKLGIEKEQVLSVLRAPHSPERVQRVYDLSSIFVIKIFENAGLDIVYNGEQLRVEMYEHAIKFIDGFRFFGHVRSFDNKYYRKASCIGKLSLKKPYHLDEFNFVKSHTSRNVKVPITGAYTLADWSFNEFYRKRGSSVNLKQANFDAKKELTLGLAREIIRPNIKALVDAGARFVQIDEPAATSHPEELSIFIESFNESVRGISGCKFSVHNCYSDYSTLFPAILDLKNCSQFAWEFANKDTRLPGVSNGNRTGYEVLSLFNEYGSKGEIGLGVTDIHVDFVESPDLIKDRIVAAANTLGPERISVNPDCGLRTRSWDVAYQKLANMVRGAELARKELGLSN